MKSFTSKSVRYPWTTFLKIKGTVKTHYAENILRDKIVEISGQKPRVILEKKLTQTTGRR
ncbi:MAG: hypothetical protein P8Z38_05720 [Robiginitalea sp.]